MTQTERRRSGLTASQAGQAIPVEGMQGLARFQHHQVGDIHHVVDRANPRLLQPPLQPGR